MLKLIRRNDEVFTEAGQKLRVVKQATKGPNMEVVNIDGLPGANGKKWIMLKLLSQGENILDDTVCHATERASQSYSLTDEEKQEIAELQAKIDAIKDAARKRYQPKLTLEKMNIEQLEAYIAAKKKELGLEA